LRSQNSLEVSMANTVLIVEDDAPTSALWTKHLRHWGWDVKAVTSAEEAIPAISRHQPRAVVLDVMLDDLISGWDLLSQLRASRYTRDLPVFVVSAVDEPKRAYREGATAFLVKPCSPHLLVSRIVAELVLMDNPNNHRVM